MCLCIEEPVMHHEADQPHLGPGPEEVFVGFQVGFGLGIRND